MLESFNSKYESKNERLQGNSDLVRSLFERTRKFSDLARNFSDWADWYEITGLKFEGIYLGLDPQEGHTMRFSDIVAKMRIIHDLTGGKVDLPRVYTLLEAKRGRELAIVSEDMSKNGFYKVEDRAPKARIAKVLSEAFYDAYGYEHGIAKMVFRVTNKNGRTVRSPVVDFDHVEIRQYHELYEKYRKEYYENPKFRIHLV